MQLAVEAGLFDTKIMNDRRNAQQPPERVIGRVIGCDGGRATILSAVSTGSWLATDAWSIGKLISINLGQSRIVALVYKVHAVETSWSDETENPIRVEVEFLGEVMDDAGAGARAFQSGIANYPPIGAVAHRIRAADLALVYDLGGRKGVVIGKITQDANIDASVDMEGLLSRHFALLGTTGVGKSSAVALLLRKAVAVRPRLRVLILDPHNEYASAFPDLALTIDGEALDLPIWMFKQEELADVVFRGRPALPDEPDILREVVATARARYRMPAAPDAARDFRVSLAEAAAGSRRPARGQRSGVHGAGNRVRRGDPLPRQGHVRRDRRAHRPSRAALAPAGAALAEGAAGVAACGPALPVHVRPGQHARDGRADPRPDLPRAAARPADHRLPARRPAGRGGERGRFGSLAARLRDRHGEPGRHGGAGACEEAHRYVPNDPGLGFTPTRQAIARIAKEGRKYGCYLGVVTQRPGELDPTILSQCSTIFAMRLANERDQQIIRSAISDASASTIAFLASIGNREAIAFGEGVATTMRMRFATLAPHELPAMSSRRAVPEGPRFDPTLDDIVRRMRA